jgi:hypothetical protein
VVEEEQGIELRLGAASSFRSGGAMRQAPPCLVRHRFGWRLMVVMCRPREPGLEAVAIVQQGGVAAGNGGVWCGSNGDD